ncbi:hypothetical protein [Actinomycetospora aeridis]|uniref:Uncharacterized protein n=1 Tax=Actinomycetospora aeridis TaxID=3129231 RepID=A0ABU8N663_9PSEU
MSGNRALTRRRALGLGGGAVVLGGVLAVVVLALYPTLDPDDAGRGLVLVGGLCSALLVSAGGQRVRRAPRDGLVRALVVFAVVSAVVGTVLVPLAAGGWTPVAVVGALAALALVALAVASRRWFPAGRPDQPATTGLPRVHG